MGRRERRRFTDDFKAGVVGLVRSSGKSIPEVSRDLDLTESAARGWVQRAETRGSSPGGLTAAEREELGRLRRQIRLLEEERTMLKKAAVFFAKETRSAAIGSSRWRRAITRSESSVACCRSPAPPTTTGTVSHCPSGPSLMPGSPRGSAPSMPEAGRRMALLVCVPNCRPWATATPASGWPG